MAWIGSIFLKILGWRIEGKIPDIKKFVIIAAPHTTNWDFPITLAITFVLKIKIYWMGKAAISAGLLAQPPGGSAVSYTHLRAHETVLDLVCRLLLEKKKK